MRTIDLDDLDRDSARIEAAVDATPGIDPWCSGPDWVVPVHHAFAPEAEPLILTNDDGGSALLARYETVDGHRLVGGLEPLWGFASPLVGADQQRLAEDLARWLHHDADWDVVALSGVPNDRHRITELATPLATLGRAGLREGITRRMLDLERDGESWLARRTTKFRRNLRRARRLCETHGVEFEIVDHHRDVFERILAIERRSWKGAEHDGITSPQMSAFYRAMLGRLDRAGRLRGVIATRAGVDHGYIVGGVRNGRYRGLQLSYSEEAAPLSLGHLLQAHEIERMTAAGLATYDMGMDMEYKRRLTDETMETLTLVVVRTTTN